MSGELPKEPAQGGTGQPTSGEGGLTVPLGVHFDSLREADRDFFAERDRRYLELAHEREKALVAALANTQRAIDKAERSMGERLEGFPETYATLERVERLDLILEELRRTAVDGAVYQERHTALQGQVNDISGRLSAIEGGTNLKAATIGWGLAALGLVITVVVIIVNVLVS